MANTKDIVNEFEKVLKDLDWYSSFGNWTRKILEHFCKLGRKLGYEFCTDTKYWKRWEKRTKTLPYKIKIGEKFRKTSGQYLVDLCWYKMEPKYQTIMAMEIEWGPDKEEVDWDFYKLMDVKAPIKVWISYIAEKRRESEFNKLTKALQKMGIKVPGEKFLIILLSRPTGNKGHPTFYHQEVFVPKWRRG